MLGKWPHKRLVTRLCDKAAMRRHIKCITCGDVKRIKWMLLLCDATVPYCHIKSVFIFYRCRSQPFVYLATCGYTKTVDSEFLFWARKTKKLDFCVLSNRKWWKTWLNWNIISFLLNYEWQRKCNGRDRPYILTKYCQNCNWSHCYYQTQGKKDEND